MIRQRIRRCVGYGVAASVFAAAGSGVLRAGEAEDVASGTTDLADVVVTATRTETPVNQLGQSVTVIDREQIEASKLTFVTDILRTVPGLDVRSYGPRTNTAFVAIRGLQTYHTKVLVDGVSVQDSASTGGVTPVLGDLTLDNVERIEIVRGPSSVVHGSNAVGGVINIITRKGTKEGTPSGHVGTEYGSNERFRTYGAVGGVQGPLDYSFSGSYESEDGISVQKDWYNADDDSYRNRQVAGRLGYQLEENLRLDVFGRYSSSDEQLDAGSVWGSWVTLDPYGDKVHYQNWLAGVKLSATDLFDGLLDSSVMYSLSEVQRSYQIEDPYHYYYKDRFRGKTNEVSWQNTLHLHERVDFTFGLDHTQEIGETIDGGVTVVDDERLRTTALFGELQVEPLDNWFISLGARETDQSKFGRETTWSASTSYLIADTGTRLKAAAGKAYRSPSLYEMYDPYSGNPGLGPETSYSWEIGFEQTLCNDTITFGTTYYRQRVEDYIDWSSETYSYDQVSGIKVQGLESFVTVHPLDNLDIRFTHSYQHTNNMDLDVSPLALRPRFRGGVDVTYRAFENRLTMNVSSLYVSHRNTGHGTSDHLDPYWLVDSAVAYKLTDTIEVYGRIHNLLNEDYEMYRGYNTYDRSYYAGVKMTF